jgi:hypothetical protein
LRRVRFNDSEERHNCAAGDVPADDGDDLIVQLETAGREIMLNDGPARCDAGAPEGERRGGLVRSLVILRLRLFSWSAGRPFPRPGLAPTGLS